MQPISLLTYFVLFSILALIVALPPHQHRHRHFHDQRRRLNHTHHDHHHSQHSTVIVTVLEASINEASPESTKASAGQVEGSDDVTATAVASRSPKSSSTTAVVWRGRFDREIR